MPASTQTAKEAIDWATATPVAFDTALADLHREWQQAIHATDTALLRARNILANRVHGTWTLNLGQVVQRMYAQAEADPGSQVAQLAEAHRAASEQNKLLSVQIADCGQVFRARGGWTRAYQVTSHDGHVHKTMQCSTCFPTTDFDWLPQVSGWGEAQIIAAAGEMACTVCYPNAPVEVRRQPCQLEGAHQRTTREQREAKAAERAAVAAAKAAKGITTRDGQPLRTEYAVVKTERTAQIECVDALADMIRWAGRRDSSQGTAEQRAAWTARCDGNSADYAWQAAALLDALAAKRGTTLLAQWELLAPKVAAKVRAYN